MVPHLRPPPHFPDKPLHQVGAPQVRPKHLGVPVELQEGPRILYPKPHHPRVPRTPGGLHLLQGPKGFIPALRPVHPPQVLRQQAPVPRPHLGQAPPHPVHHAPLPFRLRVDPADRFRKPGQPVGDEEQYPPQAPLPKLPQDPLPSQGALRGQQPKPQDPPLPIRGDAQGHIHAFPYDPFSFPEDL
uniref:Uncharacterized protein n=1 Tax=Thermus sp. 4C TaxID=446041 RepID=A6MNA1_9DEIN|nr:hypothetical protein [Thermus sp. 4C]